MRAWAAQARTLGARIGPKRGVAIAFVLAVATIGAFVFGRRDPCADYAFDPRIHAQCIVAAAADADTLDDARCDEAGDFATRCRRMWIQEHRGLPLDELLEACTDEECRFYTLDINPLPFVEHLGRCEQLPNLWGQCVSHATMRYLGGFPSRAQQVEIFAQVPRWTHVIAGHVGQYIACGGASDCGVVPGNEAGCFNGMQGVTRDHCSSFRSTFPMAPSGAVPEQRR